MEPYADKWRAFGWKVVEIADGNDMAQVVDAFDHLPDGDSEIPTVVIANTIKENISPLWSARLNGMPAA